MNIHEAAGFAVP